MLSFPITLYFFICLETPKEGLVSEPSVAVLTGIQLIVHQLVIYIIVGMRKWACAMPRIELGLQSCSAWHICLSSRIISAFLLEGSFHLAWWLYHLYSHLYSEVKHHVFIQISFCLTAEMNRIVFFSKKILQDLWRTKCQWTSSSMDETCITCHALTGVCPILNSLGFPKGM